MAGRTDRHGLRGRKPGCRGRATVAGEPPEQLPVAGHHGADAGGEVDAPDGGKGQLDGRKVSPLVQDD